MTFGKGQDAAAEWVAQRDEANAALIARTMDRGPCNLQRDGRLDHSGLRGWHVASHEHGTALSEFLPKSWDHLACQSWDHRARRIGPRHGHESGPWVAASPQADRWCHAGSAIDPACCTSPPTGLAPPPCRPHHRNSDNEQRQHRVRQPDGRAIHVRYGPSSNEPLLTSPVAPRDPRRVIVAGQAAFFPRYLPCFQTGSDPATSRTVKPRNPLQDNTFESWRGDSNP